MRTFSLNRFTVRLKNYNPKTMQAWLFAYRRGGLEGLKPGYRSDKGKSRKVSDEREDRHLTFVKHISWDRPSIQTPVQEKY
ncbi:helix-turn-helix domain-containing protein [Desulfoscipio geothermicus]|uniref:helix-turn-helix domain-containing protein n=1 Tax=Desulfoscipio geothermicus TaxID=39060 RepID=UPI000B81058B|nr:helix-turn-helix domain-containing protein [Desulfoscipio geothermicus]